jgi:hypothetical protein
VAAAGHNDLYERSQAREDEQSSHWVHYIVTGGGGADGDHNPWSGWDYEDPPYERVYADPSSPLNYFHYLTVDVPGGAGNPVLKHWRHRDGQAPLLVETVTIGEPPPGW